MVGKAFWQGFYWPTPGLPFFTNQVHTPAQELQMIPIT
jgi:hypothetical protein